MNRKNWLINFPKSTIIFFIIFNILAMLSYPGGTIHNTTTSGYSFITNFLSDLGRFISWNGNHNYFSSLFFNTSMMITGFVFSIFFIQIRYIFNIKNGLINWISIIGTICGIAGGYSMIGVGLTPSDLYFDQHVLFANWLFRFFFLSAICYTIIIYKSDLIETKYAIGYCIFAFLILFYIFLSELGPNARENMSALYLQVIAQKSILLCFIITIYSQTKGLESLVD